MLTKKQAHAVSDALLQEPRVGQLSHHQQRTTLSWMKWRFLAALIGAIGGTIIGYSFTRHFTNGGLIGLFAGLAIGRIFEIRANNSSKRTREKPRAA